MVSVERAMLLAVMLFLLGCGTKVSEKPKPVKTAVTEVDPSDLLQRHLVRRISDLTTQIGKLENEVLEHDNRCLQEQIAELEGHPSAIQSKTR
jgi:hypothetical protein